MSTRKAPIEDEENAPKRQRVQSALNAASDSASEEQEHFLASFDNLNTDCIVHIMSYLFRDDMDTVAICNRTCREARNNEIFDQTRTGIIVVTENSSIDSINNAITNGGWNTIFSGNRTRLKIIGFERLQLVGIGDDIAQLTGVTSLDLSLPDDGLDLEVDSRYVRKLIQMCPNVADIDLSHVKVSHGVHVVWNACLNSTRVSWKGCRGLLVCGMSSRHAGMEVNLSDAVFRSGNLQRTAMTVYGTDDHDESTYLLRYCPELRRLDIKNASWRCNGMNGREDLPQDIIIKMVRHHPNLVWLRSDLTSENVAMLKRERPEITFVSE
jgi:hypothetical protein